LTAKILESRHRYKVLMLQHFQRGYSWYRVGYFVAFRHAFFLGPPTPGSVKSNIDHYWRDDVLTVASMTGHVLQTTLEIVVHFV
jgi:hypothetical protein